MHLSTPQGGELKILKGQLMEPQLLMSIAVAKSLGTGQVN
jgi:hypothetical protein